MIKTTSAFIEAIKDRLPTLGRRWFLHRDDTDEEYLISAMRRSPSKVRQVLLAMLSDGPDAAWNRALNSPGLPALTRVMAAYWFLRGHSAGFWTAMPREVASACALITAHLKEEAPMAPQKTKAGLARGAGDVSRNSPSTLKKKSGRPPQYARDDFIERGYTLMREGNMMKAILADPNAGNEARLDACLHYFDAFKYLMPEESRRFWANVRGAFLAHGVIQ